MGKVAVLGIFVADAAFRADRMPVMGETILGNSFALGPGGKGSNQAVAAAKMGAEVAFISALGADAFAQMARDMWTKAGVTPVIREIADSYTGAAFIYVDEASGDNAIIVSPGAAGLVGPQDIERARADIESAAVFMTQLEQPMDAAMEGLRVARAAGVTTLLNPAPAAELSREMLALCDYITPNETETEAIAGVAVTDAESAKTACAALKDMGVGVPIITMGAQGVYLDGHGMIPAINAGKVVETTGAGDAFNGGFAAALAEGKSAREAAQFGCVVAGISVTRPGAASSMPTRAEVGALL
ncbi:ribokinase [Litoreibacter janthinus]|uniref:Ribokinase n=1 Tax=Litoreibacter janthinus TaxID=670154 RepID=A0A1I6IEF4_9RHOB|nr:ribokinase [Litoreibacter janthinus]SFR65145.1 ribokinase [Litoreibacter janthinus]